MFSEEETYNSRLQDLKKMISGSPITSFFSKIPFLQGIPMSPFPKYQRCMGITPYQGQMEILDRYMRIGFNVKLEKADEACLYADFEPVKANPFGWNLNLADINKAY